MSKYSQPRVKYWSAVASGGTPVERISESIGSSGVSTPSLDPLAADPSSPSGEERPAATSYLQTTRSDRACRSPEGTRTVRDAARASQRPLEEALGGDGEQLRLAGRAVGIEQRLAAEQLRRRRAIAYSRSNTSRQWRCAVGSWQAAACLPSRRRGRRDGGRTRAARGSGRRRGSRPPDSTSGQERMMLPRCQLSPSSSASSSTGPCQPSECSRTYADG